MLPQTMKVMRFLRSRNRLIGKTRPLPKIHDWVDGYLDSRALEGRKVNILTQWCVSANLATRKEQQGGIFVSTPKEQDLFEKEIPRISEAFRENGFALSWWLTLNQPYLASWRADEDTETKYRAMLEMCAQSLVEEGWFLIASWEQDVIGGSIEPEFFEVERVLDEELVRVRMDWIRQRETEGDVPVPPRSENALRRDTVFKIACEATEGKFLVGPDSPFGDFILVPLEAAEQYDQFGLLAPGFSTRIVSVLPLYPWRLKK